MDEYFDYSEIDVNAYFLQILHHFFSHERTSRRLNFLQRNDVLILSLAPILSLRK